MMQLKTRISAISTAITFAVLSLFVAVPANASGHGGDLDTLAPFDHTGEPHNYVAIAIVAVVVLLVVLGLAQLLSAPFGKKK